MQRIHVSTRRAVVSVAAVALLIVGSSSSRAQGDEIERTVVFRSGAEGYSTFRIPAIVQAHDGTLLAFAEGRKNSRSDHGNIDIVLKRSTDGGKTWGPLQVVLDSGNRTSQNPAPVVDRNTGDVLLLTSWNTPGHGEGDIRNGTPGAVRSVWIQRSTDNGQTWSQPSKITDSVKQPNWRWYATGPVHGIQIECGEHAGRLVVPANHSTDQGSGNQYLGAHAIYSDDGGATWKIGAVDLPGTGVINPNETTVVELTDGRLYFNTRDQDGSSPATRAIAHSNDGGQSFQNPFAAESALVSPVMQASLERIQVKDQGSLHNLIVFSSPMDWSVRKNLTLRYTLDETKNWQTGPLVHDGPSAYSDLVKMSDNLFGVFYEAGQTSPYETITFARVPVAALGIAAPER